MAAQARLRASSQTNHAMESVSTTHFLGSCKLAEYADKLTEQGYNDLADLVSLTESELSDLTETIAMKPGHAKKLVRLLNKLKAINNDALQPVAQSSTLQPSRQQQVQQPRREESIKYAIIKSTVTLVVFVLLDLMVGGWFRRLIHNATLGGNHREKSAAEKAIERLMRDQEL